MAPPPVPSYDVGKKRGRGRLATAGQVLNVVVLTEYGKSAGTIGVCRETHNVLLNMIACREIVCKKVHAS